MSLHSCRLLTYILYRQATQEQGQGDPWYPEERQQEDREKVQEVNISCFWKKLGFYGNLVRHHGQSRRLLYFVLFHDGAQYRHLSQQSTLSSVWISKMLRVQNTLGWVLIFFIFLFCFFLGESKGIRDIFVHRRHGMIEGFGSFSHVILVCILCYNIHTVNSPHPSKVQ